MFDRITVSINFTLQRFANHWERKMREIHPAIVNRIRDLQLVHAVHINEARIAVENGDITAAQRFLELARVAEAKVQMLIKKQRDIEARLAKSKFLISE